MLFPNKLIKYSWNIVLCGSAGEISWEIHVITAGVCREISAWFTESYNVKLSQGIPAGFLDESLTKLLNTITLYFQWIPLSILEQIFGGVLEEKPVRISERIPGILEWISEVSPEETSKRIRERISVETAQKTFDKFKIDFLYKILKESMDKFGIESKDDFLKIMF